MITATDLKNDLHQAAVHFQNLTLLQEAFKFCVYYLSDPVLRLGRVRLGL